MPGLLEAPSGAGRPADPRSAGRALVNPLDQYHPASSFEQARHVRPGPVGGSRAPSVRRSLVAPTDAAADFIQVSDVGPSRPFAEVVADRVSSRRLTPPSAEEIGLVIARAGLSRATATDSTGMAIGSRAAPSAGGRHPFELALLARDVRGIPPGLWVLDAHAAVLRRGTITDERATSALADIADATRAGNPPAAVFVVADPALTLSRYPLGDSLLWREAGALLMLLHLAATDIGLSSCIVGTTGRLLDNEPYQDGPIDLGCVCLGHLAPDPAPVV
ncbi:nitroreductase family protein [Gordonia sp. i37]|uniref:nitroreductase family protein n=1 Tax=Gordonia sp. i37 TaxID=1961707 RepID=UPI00111800EF|nr:nitroreductase family protein [Gordonia sp. i37]